MKFFFNSIYYFFVLCLVGIGVLLLGTMTSLGGNIKIKIVKSGSMEPAIMTGSIVIIKPEPTYRVGDIVTFGLDTKTQIPTTHRIVEVSDDPNPMYTTKGDANEDIDPSNTRRPDVHGGGGRQRYGAGVAFGPVFVCRSTTAWRPATTASWHFCGRSC